MSSLLGKVHSAVHQLGSDLQSRLAGQGEEFHGHTHSSGQCSDGSHGHNAHRYSSFAPQRDQNDAKWYVDGCGYMWAVSRAIEEAKKSIWILDWWLSPELYLRRPPARNEQYRIDRILEAAAMRGVKVNIIVYKEVTQALTRKYLNPTLPNYLHSLLPGTTDPITRLLTRLGLDAIFRSLEEIEDTDPLIRPPITVSSSHTKHALEKLHPNICVFRHPDHLPDRQVLQSNFLSSFQNLNLTAATASSLPGDALKAIYGVNEGNVLYWAHHEKLCLIDDRIAFMGGLDLCYGRWDSYQHAIADAHPGDLDKIIFPGQDYNNARVMDFHDVVHWQSNKLDRTKNSRMGWSDVSICLSGPIVEDLRAHFVERWNFIYDEKYVSRSDSRYTRLNYIPSQAGVVGEYSYSSRQPSNLQAEAGDPEQSQYFPPPPRQEDRSLFSHGREGGFRDKLKDQMGDRLHRYGGNVLDAVQHAHQDMHQSQSARPQVGMVCQLTRSCANWSHGVRIEHSIASAYMDVIKNSRHFVYIENQFFITATSDKQKPVHNKIGAAIVERILRAARSGERHKIFVMMPAVPAFAGDLQHDDSLGTRAIMEFQYNSINRGGNSIMETIARAGFDPMEYIRFYNCRNYDRINSSAAMHAAEQQSGVSYEEARQQYDERIGGGFSHEVRRPEYQYGQSTTYGRPESEGVGQPPSYTHDSPYERYQQGARQTRDFGSLGSGRWDSVAECYMLGGEDIRNVPWENGTLNEMDAFVSEELYIHSKLLVADDRIVICGSANLNDRSQNGDHDSEIAMVIEDPVPVDSYMNGRPWKASRFAASLRRQIFRKHLGLLRPQHIDRPDENFEPIGIPNVYDWGSTEDQSVIDPMADHFLNLWYSRAKTNTDAFARVFHPVPYDGVRTWKQYDDFYGRFFKGDDKDPSKPSKYQWGHVVAENFSPGEQGVREVKEILSTIRGTLVEMPLLFLKDEDIAKEGLGLNAFTEAVYT